MALNCHHSQINVVNWNLQEHKSPFVMLSPEYDESRIY